MKPLRLIAAVLILGLIVYGCASAPEIGEAGTWTDGVYEEATEGRNGEFTVVVTIKDGFLAGVDVGLNRETPERGGIALKIMPEEMIVKQTYDVDGVTGATITSQALKKAVAACLGEATLGKRDSAGTERLTTNTTYHP